MEEIETYIGNIESGKSGSIDSLTNAVATTAASGDMSKVIVTKRGMRRRLRGISRRLWNLRCMTM